MRLVWNDAENHLPAEFTTVKVRGGSVNPKNWARADTRMARLSGRSTSVAEGRRVKSAAAVRSIWKTAETKIRIAMQLTPIPIAKFLKTVGRVLKPPTREPVPQPVLLPTPTPQAEPRFIPAKVTVEPEPPTSSRERLIAKCHVMGKELARVTKGLKPDAVVLKALEERAVAISLAEILPSFGPADNLIDRRTEARIAALDAELAEGDDECKIAAAHSRRRQEELAKHAPYTHRPAASDLFRWTAALGITISLAPTIHDLLSGMFPLLKWVVAMGFGASFALFIVVAILADEQRSE
jgi:hypothetical protein